MRLHRSICISSLDCNILFILAFHASSSLHVRSPEDVYRWFRIRMVLQVQNALCSHLQRQQRRPHALGRAGARPAVLLSCSGLRLDAVAPLPAQVRELTFPAKNASLMCNLRIWARRSFLTFYSDHASIVSSALPCDCKAVGAGSYPLRVSCCAVRLLPCLRWSDDVAQAPC